VKVYNWDTEDTDEVVVERILSGQPAGAPRHPADTLEVVRRAARMGYSDGQIAHMLGMYRRSVIRTRKQHGIPAALPSDGGKQPVRTAPTRARAAG
jgi:hypothetical protein